MASKITYDDKISLTTSALPRANKCTDTDLNEIKQVVNDNADEININAGNITNIQQDLIDLDNKFKGSILYDNSTGTLGNVTLNDSAENYDYIEIYYKTNTRSGSKKIADFSGKTLELSFSITAPNTFVSLTKQVQISGTSITKISENQYMSSGGGITTTDTVYIYRVIGYKY